MTEKNSLVVISFVQNAIDSVTETSFILLHVQLRIAPDFIEN